MEIIFVRHAKAEDKSFGMSDKERALTKEGINKLESKLAKLEENLVELKNIRLYASPAKRTVETAEILGKHLGLELETLDFLYEQDTEGLYDFLSSLDEESRVILVGHQPSLSEWVHLLSGQDIAFRKAEMKALAKVKTAKLYTLGWQI